MHRLLILLPLLVAVAACDNAAGDERPFFAADCSSTDPGELLVAAWNDETEPIHLLASSAEDPTDPLPVTLTPDDGDGTAEGDPGEYYVGEPQDGTSTVTITLSWQYDTGPVHDETYVFDPECDS
jgi:hypothetical protein